jgi:Ca2+-binding RTX toxin-like protein
VTTRESYGVRVRTFGRRCRRWAVLGAAALGASATAAAQTIDNTDAIDSGCVEDGPTGWYVVTYNGAAQEILIVDTDNDDLPDEAWCPGDSSATSVTTTGSDTCTSLNTVNSANCAFTIYVWRGDSSADNNGAGVPVSCALAAGPVLMFGAGGVDILTGSNHGDVIHGGSEDDVLDGGGGKDLICLGPGNDFSVPVQTGRGGGGDDIVWGGPNDDVVEGGGDSDLVTGAAGDDEVFGDGDQDHCGGGAGDDVIEGNLAADYVRGGLGVDTIRGLSQEDLLFAQDLTTDAVIDGGADADACWFDTVEDLGVPVSCSTSHDMDACDFDYPLFVATDPATTPAELYELGFDGTRNRKGTITVNLMQASHVDALAVDPTTCLLWALLWRDGTQQLANFDPVNDYAGGGTYVAADIGDTVGQDKVDIAFSSRGMLFAVTEDREILRLDKGDASDIASHGYVGRGTAATRMAYDATDAGSLLVTTTGSGDGYDVDAFDVVLDRSRPVESFVDWDDGALPFTVSQFGDAGAILEIGAPVLGAFPIWDRGRRNWGEGPDRVEWTALGTCVTQCLADIDDEPTAITVPHFNQ